MGLTSPFRFQEPLTKISQVTLGQPVSIECPLRKRLAAIILCPVVTMAANGAGTTSIPLPKHAFGEIRFNMNGNTQRKRTADMLFGAQGLNALNDARNAGMVVYSQAGNGNLSALPVLIGSAADTAQKALLAQNTITVATFFLPIIFAEDFRKEYAAGEVMALITGFDDGSGFRSVVLEADVPATAAVGGSSVGAVTSVSVTASYEYDELVAKAGTTVMLSKEKLLGKQYAAVGDIEVGDQIINKEVLQRVSLLTATDKISKVIVKQGSRILRNVTYEQNLATLAKAGYNIAACPINRFDLEFDVNDDPNSAPVLDPSQELSIVATLATANDAGKLIQILPSYFGAVE